MSRYRVLVTLKPALLDSAGRAVTDSLRAMGFESVEDVRVGKLIDVTLRDGSKQEVEDMAKRLLANPVIETFEVVETA